jgi:antitoxin StbD
MSITQPIFARHTISVTELSRNPSKVLEVASHSPVAVIYHNKPTAYLLSAAAYKDMLEQLEDIELSEIVKARARGKTVKVSLPM